MTSLPVYLSGSKPGVFDPSQPARLLRYPDSDLVFASFNPLNIGTYSTNQLGRAGRVVVEIPRSNSGDRPNWFSFVPRAVLAAGVENEGRWPRVVNYCGRWVVCDQDQWDIHKLDPVYECVVPGSGMYPSITRKVPAFPDGATRPGKRNLSPSPDNDPAGKKARGAPPPDPPAQPSHSGFQASNSTYRPAAEDTVPTDYETSSTSTHSFSASTSADGFASFTASASLRSENSLLSLTSLSSTSASSNSTSAMSVTSTSTVKPGPSSSRTRSRTNATPLPPQSAETRPPVTPKRPATPAPRKSSARAKRTNPGAASTRKKRSTTARSTAQTGPNVASGSASNTASTFSAASSATLSTPAAEMRPPTPEIVDLTMDKDDIDVVMRSPSPFNADSTPRSRKRKETERTSSSEDLSGSPQGGDRAPKRSRAVSPGAAKAEYEKKRAQRKRDRERRAKGSDNEGITAERTKQLWEDVMKNVQEEGQLPAHERTSNIRGAHIAQDNAESTPVVQPAGQATRGADAVPGAAGPSIPIAEPKPAATPASESAVDPEEARRASIRESQRKLAELEKDKPLWDEAAARRVAEVQAEAAALHARQQSRQRATEAALAEQARQRAEAAAAAYERGRAAYARREPERRERMQQQRERWLPWTPQRAIDRFIEVSDEFHRSKFSEENQVDLLCLPWPVLHSPFTLRIDTIDWQMVEEFFRAARSSMSTADYKLFVAESHTRLHPDRWRARGVFTIFDDRARAILHEACTTVSQALTPIWM